MFRGKGQKKSARLTRETGAGWEGLLDTLPLLFAQHYPLSRVFAFLERRPTYLFLDFPVLNILIRDIPIPDDMAFLMLRKLADCLDAPEICHHLFLSRPAVARLA